jgi:hypothetical protein
MAGSRQQPKSHEPSIQRGKPSHALRATAYRTPYPPHKHDATPPSRPVLQKATGRAGGSAPHYPPTIFFMVSHRLRHGSSIKSDSPGTPQDPLRRRHGTCGRKGQVPRRRLRSDLRSVRDHPTCNTGPPTHKECVLFLHASVSRAGRVRLQHFLHKTHSLCSAPLFGMPCSMASSRQQPGAVNRPFNTATHHTRYRATTLRLVTFPA